MMAVILYVLGIFFGYQAQLEVDKSDKFDSEAFATAVFWPVFGAILAVSTIYDQGMKLFNK